MGVIFTRIKAAANRLGISKGPVKPAQPPRPPAPPRPSGTTGGR